MDIIQPLLAVVLVLALLCGALFLLRNRGAASFHLPRLSSSVPKRLEVLERVALGPHYALHVVRMGSRSIVVATAPSSCTFLCDLPAEPESRQP